MLSSLTGVLAASCGTTIRIGDIMGREKHAARRLDEERESGEMEPPDPELQDRTLVLRKEPLPRKVQLMAAGVKEIRCIGCLRIRPIAGAEELAEGWVCEDCLPEATEERRCG